MKYNALTSSQAKCEKPILVTCFSKAYSNNPIPKGFKILDMRNLYCSVPQVIRFNFMMYFWVR